MTRAIVGSIEAEYRRYQSLAEKAMEQLAEAELCQTSSPGGNSIATLVWHISGNLKSRFTDFLHSDGEKPWRQRDDEFLERSVSRAALRQKWEEGWSVLLASLAELDDQSLPANVTIRGVALTVHDALHRSLAHTSYHVGQIVFLAKERRADAWRTLTIPRGGSAAYNADPTYEKPAAARTAHAALAILIAGPYRSGTGDDPAKMAENVRLMEACALPLFRAGHVPIVGEWLALPLVALAGSRRVGDAAFDEVFHPIAERLLRRCDAVLRVGGPSAGADLMLKVAKERGLQVFHELREVPGCQ